MQPNSVYGSRFAIPQELGWTASEADQGASGLATFVNPPKATPTDTRAVRDVLINPHLQFYDPHSLHFAETQKLSTASGVPPGGGGYVSMGIGMVTYDHQPRWDRAATEEAGPVREFFRRVLFDNRTKHL